MNRKQKGENMGEKLLSEIMADFALDLKLDSVPEEVKRFGKMLVIDTLGVAMAAYNLEHAKIVRDTVVDIQSKPESILWGTKKRVGMADAVLANGSLVHGMDYDDTHVKAIVHPSACVVNTALTVGEAVGASGEEIFNAMLCGWEIMVRLGIAANGRFHDVGYHATGIVGPFASACVAAKLLKLPKEVLVNALGICGSQAAGLQEFLRDGSWVKKIHPGWASHSAIYALLMAKRGFTGIQQVFEGEFGVWRTHLRSIDGLRETFNDFGNRWYTKEVAVKLYPCCHFTHSFIDCVLALKKQYGFSAADIERIECRIIKRSSIVCCEPIEVKRRPTTDYAMRFSLPYVLSMAIVKGWVGPEEINEKYIGDSRLNDLMDRIDVIVDEKAESPGHFPGWVKVFLRNGQVYEKIQKYERGASENPISEDDVINKYRNNMKIQYPAAKTDAILNSVLNIEQSKGIADILKNLEIE
jgi:2-methylcitrate dehydratase PrpD